MTPYIFQRGETISLALDAVSGNPLDVTGITATLKAVPPGRTSVSVDTPLAAAFNITPRVAVGDVPPGWTLTITDAVSASLGVGAYLADARLVLASGVIITEPVAIRINASVSA